MKALQGFLAELRASHEAAALREARGWIVVCRDDENGKLDYYGDPDGKPYAEPAAATEAASMFAADLNASADPVGWTCWAAPLFATSPRPTV